MAERERGLQIPSERVEEESRSDQRGDGRVQVCSSAPGARMPSYSSANIKSVALEYIFARKLFTLLLLDYSSDLLIQGKRVQLALPVQMAA